MHTARRKTHISYKREKQHNNKKTRYILRTEKRRLQVKQKHYHPLFPFLMVGPFTYTHVTKFKRLTPFTN